jgi:hypothetical protein
LQVRAWAVRLLDISLDRLHDKTLLPLNSLTMFQDEIVEEIHRIREAYSRSFNHDLKAIFADLQKQQAESGREVVDLSAKRRSTSKMQQMGENC